ncbi:MAG: YkvA family protein [Pseudomonadota bacterium]
MTDAAAMDEDTPAFDAPSQMRQALPIPTVEAERTTRRRFIPKLLKVAGRIPFADDLAAAYYAALDPATPRKAKAVLFAALGYFVIPTDALPDVITGFGFTDDATVLATALGVVGAHVQDHHRRAARRLLRLPEPPPGR